MYREQTPADFYLSYSKVQGSHDSPTGKISEDLCPELISGFGTMTTSATFSSVETNTATNFENSISHS